MVFACIIAKLEINYYYYYKSTDYNDASLKLQGYFTYQIKNKKLS